MIESEVEQLTPAGPVPGARAAGRASDGNGAPAGMVAADVGEALELPLRAPEGYSNEQGDSGSRAASSDGVIGQGEALVTSERVRDLQVQSDHLRDQLAQRDEEVQRLRESLQGAAMKYRQALLAAYPVIPEDLLSGATVEELEESLDRARAAVDQVRKKLEEDMARSLSVPAGAPVRRGPDLASLSPREKIIYGLNNH